MDAKCARCGATLSSFDASCPACGARGEVIDARAVTVATPTPPPSGGAQSSGSSPQNVPPVALKAPTNIAEDPFLQAVPMTPSGKVLGGVKLVRRLGAGGMGAVYAGQHLTLETTVAIKILPAHLTGDENYEERFKREARLSFEIAHPNIVRTLHAGKEFGLLFLQMEFVDGTSAGELVRTQGRLPEARALEIILDATRGLAEAHRRGIIHRDVKPDNILVEKTTGRAKIADLGLARIAAAAKTAPAITGAGTTLGTPAYMAPEQIEDASHVEPTADIYSLGAALFELVCGRAPFAAETIPSLFRAILSSPAPDPRDYRADISPVVRDLILRCLEKDPKARFQEADELAAALEAALPAASRNPPSRKFPPQPPPPTPSKLIETYHAPSSAPTAPPPPPPPPQRSRKSLYVGVGLAIVAALVGGFWLGTEAPGPPEKKTLLFGFLPDRRLTTERLKALQPVTQHLEKLTRRKWEAWVGASYEDNIEAFVSGKLDLAQFGGVTYVLLKEREPDAIPCFQRDTDQKFQALFVVPAGSSVEKLTELKGKEVAFVDELSTAGFVIPAIELLNAGVDPAKDVRAKFLHAHDEVLREVAEGNVDAGAVDARVKDLLSFQGKIDREKLKTIKTSAPFPDDVWVASPRLDAKLRKKIVDGFTSLDGARGNDGQVLAALEANQYIPADDATYDDLRAKVKLLHEKGLLKAGASPDPNKR
jgi:phosphate/phosphite/phosphonate ABC transporter binding protein